MNAPQNQGQQEYWIAPGGGGGGGGGGGDGGCGRLGGSSACGGFPDCQHLPTMQACRRSVPGSWPASAGCSGALSSPFVPAPQQQEPLRRHFVSAQQAPLAPSQYCVSTPVRSALRSEPRSVPVVAPAPQSSAPAPAWPHPEVVRSGWPGAGPRAAPFVAASAQQGQPVLTPQTATPWQSGPGPSCASFSPSRWATPSPWASCAPSTLSSPPAVLRPRLPQGWRPAGVPVPAEAPPQSVILAAPAARP